MTSIRSRILVPLVPLTGLARLFAGLGTYASVHHRVYRELDRTLQALARRLWWGLGALFVVLVGLPTWIVSRALRPLRRLSREADRLGPAGLRERLSTEGIDAEVLALVGALNRALDRVMQAFEQQRRFTADAAHELRTPLSALRARCEVALRRDQDPGALRAALTAAHRLALRLGDLVESLLALSRLERGGEISSITSDMPVDLCPIVRDAVLLHEAEAQGKAVHVEARLPAALAARGDPLLLLECLANLVGNAVRYTPPGGRVLVEGAAAPQPSVTVSDTGIGIPEEHLERIFERFHRVDKARSRADGGTGLGLSIAAEIARLHGGEITVESRLGQGSRFILRLPRPAGQPSE